MAFIDLTGEKFERWTVDGLSPDKKNGGRCYFCTCECGTKRVVAAFLLKSRQSRSCGCLSRELSSQRHAIPPAPKIIDLTDRTFGRWTVEKLSDRRSKDGKGLYWWCVCSCEDQTRREVLGGDLKRGGSHRRGSLSCGCLMRELTSIRSTKHGMAHHPAYNSWQGADQRCNNPNYPEYTTYGGRGIQFCERWKDDFAAFWEDMGATWKEGLSIDRIDTDGDYEPSNCRWATPKEQANNRRNNTFIATPSGEMTIALAAEEYGVSVNTIHARIRYGWNEDELLKPVR